MRISLSATSNRPIYEQIYSQLSSEILSGEISTGEMLPSIRALARELNISVITTKRAYDELEGAGLIYTVAGKGCFVSQGKLDLARERRLNELEGKVIGVIRVARGMGMSDEEIFDWVKLIASELH